MIKLKDLVILLLISHINIASAELSSDILNIKIEMRDIDYEQLQNCSQELRKECNIKLALNNMHPNNRLQNKPGDLDYDKAEQYLTPITGESVVARMLLGEIEMHQGKRKEALALISSSGTEGFAPALDNLTISSALVYAGQTSEFRKRRTLKWQYKYYEQQKDPDIAYQIAAHFITPPYKDCAAAKLWFARATEGHNANINAQQLLGEQYETGDCMPQDYVMAYMMYDLGGTAAAEQKHALAKKVTPEQVNEGTLRSYQWQEQNHSYRVGYGAGNGYDIHWNIH